MDTDHQAEEAWVLGVQRKLYQQSKANPDEVWRDLWGWFTDLRMIRHSWRRVASNKGKRSAGIDGITVKHIQQRVGEECFLEGLRTELRSGAYRPSPSRRKLIPKAGKPGQFRPLGIPTVKDRVVQGAIKALLEPIFEAQFWSVSYGFRPGRSTHGALEHIPPLFAPSEGRGGKLLPLPPCTAHLKSSGRDDAIDVGVLAFPALHLGSFQRRVFLAGTEIEKGDRLDDHSIKSFYFVLGYSASTTQVKVSHAERRIHQQSFHVATSPVDAAEYLQEKISQADHILLDFDHKEIVVGRRRENPPKLQGVSGGGIFQISRDTYRSPLIAIATQNRRRSRLIMGTRIKHFLAVARELKTTSQLKKF